MSLDGQTLPHTFESFVLTGGGTFFDDGRSMFMLSQELVAVDDCTIPGGLVNIPLPPSISSHRMRRSLIGLVGADCCASEVSSGVLLKSRLDMLERERES